MAGETYSGEALRDALKAGEFEKPQGSVELLGMVKESDDESSIAFTPRGCDTWVEVPISMIDSAERVGLRQCAGHSHPVFRLRLKEPDGEKAKVLSALLAAVPQQAPSAGQPAGLGRPPRVPPRRGGLLARRRSPGWWGGLGEIVSAEDCEEFCIQLYQACQFRPYPPGAGEEEAEQRRTECYWLYELCEAACWVIT